MKPVQLLHLSMARILVDLPVAKNALDPMPSKINRVS